MDSKEIREEARKREYLAWACLSDKDALDVGMESYAFSAYKHGYESALSTIDPEAIRRECEYKNILKALIDWNDHERSVPLTMIVEKARAAIISAKPAQSESEESKDERLALKQQLGAGCHDECGELPAEDDGKDGCTGCWLDDGKIHYACNYCERAKTDLYKTESEINAIDRAAEVKRRIDEAGE